MDIYDIYDFEADRMTVGEPTYIDQEERRENVR